MANLVKIWWTTKLLTRNLMDSSYILFSGTPNPSSFCIHTLLYRVIVNSAAKLQSGCDKNWHREKKNEEGRLNCRWKTFGRKSHRQQTLCCFCVGLMFAFNSAFFHTSGRSCWKSFMVACKHMKKNTQVVLSANSSGSIKQLKQFSQRVQTSLLADADVSISLQIRLR